MAGSVITDPRIGTELSGYRIEELVGQGGMGVVYRAFDHALERPVALKLIKPELAEDERFRKRFLRESRVAASIDHSHIVPIHDAGEWEGELYIAMRYVEGSDLRTLTSEEGPLKPSRALAILSQAASALDAAHARGLVHRDVKPANILITAEAGRAEHVYLSDFGLSKPASSQEEGMESVQLSGSSDYAAPEQIEGKTVDRRTDVYSLGCVLYECLTGVAPFRSSSPVGVLFGHLSTPPPSATEKHPELEPGIDAVVAKAMAKDPEDRYSTSNELIEAARAELLPEPGMVDRLEGKGIAVLVFAALLVTAAVAVPSILLGRSGAAQSDTSPTTDLESLDSPVLQRIDPRTNEIVATVPIKISSLDTSTRAKRHTASEGAVWSVSPTDRTVQRLDAATNTIDRSIGVRGTPRSVATDAEFVWVTSLLEDEGTLTKIDAASGQILKEFDLGLFVPRSLAVGETAVWVAGQGLGDVFGVELGPGGGALIRIHRDAGTTTAIPLVGIPWDVTVADGYIWVGGGKPLEGFVAVIERIDLETNSIESVDVTTTDRVHIPSLAAGESYVWLAGTQRGLTQIDPETLSLRTIELESKEINSQSFRVAVGHGSVWVTQNVGGAVSRLDPMTGAVLETIDVGPSAGGLTVGNNAVWAEACGEPHNEFAGCANPFASLDQ